jgi:hypothetical protein
MKWITVPALAMSLVASPWASADFINFTRDANGFVTSVFFDETQLSEAAEAAAGVFGYPPGSFNVFFVAAGFVPVIDPSPIFRTVGR